MARAMIGVGPALRRARENRGKSLDEASRDTKIRVDLLRALEKERFEVLPGDVYVRGFLRSYGQYLGLDADKVVGMYEEHVQARPDRTDEVPSPFLSDEPSEPEMRPRRASSWVLAVGIAATLFIIAAATGLLSGSKSTPDPAELPEVIVTASPAAGDRVLLEMFAAREVDATIVVDGVEEFVGLMQAKEARTYRGGHEITVMFSKGGTVRLVVNREDLGSPGTVDASFTATYTPESGGDPMTEEEEPSPTA